MYNRYLDVREEQEVPPAGAPEEVRQGKRRPAPEPRARPSDLMGEVTEGLGALLGGLFKNLSMENLDAGDILLVLIILFLYLEGDNLELVITLGLMLLFGLGESC